MMSTKKLLLVNANYFFASAVTYSSYIRGSVKHVLLTQNSRNWKTAVKISSSTQNASIPKETGVTHENSQKPSSSKTSKYVYAGVGSAVLGGSLFTLLYLRSMKKKKTSSGSSSDTKLLKFPESSTGIPSKVPYLLIGGGTASFSAFRAIKSSDPTAKVLMISDELYYPYMKPPLSKEMWFADDDSIKRMAFKQWNDTERSVFYEPEDFYIDCTALENSSKGGIAVVRGYTVIKLDPIKRLATLDDGKVIEYEKCLIATGERPKNLPVFEKAEGSIKNKVTVFRNIDDFKRLYSALKGAKSLAVIGGDFLGSELATSIALVGKQKGLNVTHVFSESGAMDTLLPHYLSLWTTNKMRDMGVHVLCNTEIEKVSQSSDKKKVVLHLKNGNELKVDHVALTVGTEPNTDLAESSNLEIHPGHGGFVVNTEFQARTNLYCAGGCACFYDAQFGRRRIDHHDHAVISGRLAGENMVTPGKPYWHQSMFWTDLGPEISYEGIGIIDSSLPTVGIFAKPSEDSKENEKKSESENKVSSEKHLITTSSPKEGESYEKGVIFYLRDGIIVGIVLWNLFNKMAVARQVLKEQKKYEDFNEVAKFFELHN